MPYRKPGKLPKTHLVKTDERGYIKTACGIEGRVLLRCSREILGNVISAGRPIGGVTAAPDCYFPPPPPIEPCLKCLAAQEKALEMRQPVSCAHTPQKRD